MVNFNPNSEMPSTQIESGTQSTKSKAGNIFKDSVNQDRLTTQSKVGAINQKISSTSNKIATDLQSHHISKIDVALVKELKNSIDALQKRHVVVEHIHQNIAFVRRNNIADNAHFNSHKAELKKQFEGKHHNDVKFSHIDIQNLIEKMIEIAPDAKSAYIPKAMADKHNIQTVIYLDELPADFDLNTLEEFDASTPSSERHTVSQTHD